MKFRNGRILPDEAITIPIRQHREVVVLNLPYDLKKSESDRIGKIIMAHVDPSIESGVET